MVAADGGACSTAPGNNSSQSSNSRQLYPRHEAEHQAKCSTQQPEAGGGGGAAVTQEWLTFTVADTASRRSATFCSSSAVSGTSYQGAAAVIAALCGPDKIKD